MRRRGELFAPAVVLTGRQTAGRGRGTNTWWSSAGVLTVTFILPLDEQRQPQQLPLLAGLAVREAAEELTGSLEMQLKWPNDVLWQGRKLAGLLCERAHKADLVGIGLNVSFKGARVPRSLRPSIVALAQIAPSPPSLTDALLSLSRHLMTVLQQSKSQLYAKILRQYDRHHALIGHTVKVDCGFGQIVRGRCEGIDDLGRLLVREGPHLRHLLQGHVSIVI